MTTQPNTIKKLRRSSTDKMIAGVCGGWATYLGIDAAVLRILTVIAVILGFGLPILIYIACWILMPLDTQDTPTPQPPQPTTEQPTQPQATS